jgi:DHA1 family multidrug resistance protein-like MFS transporter
MGKKMLNIAMGALAFSTCLLVIVLLPPDKATRGTQKTNRSVPVKKMLSHRIVLGILVQRFLAASGQGAVYTFLPVLALQFELTSSQVGVILSANVFLIAFLQRSSGRLSDRANPKYLVITGTLVSGLAVLGMPFVEGFMMILGLNILMGLANGLSLPGGLAITGRLGRTMGMASLMSMSDAAMSLGMIVSPILSGIILDVWGLSHVFVIGSVLILAGGVAVAAFLKDYLP